MELNIGDYVRTKNLGGSIEKIIEVIPKEKTPDLIEKYLTDVSGKYSITISEDEIIKSSPNIVDLLETGDLIKYKHTKQIQQVLYINENELDLTDYVINDLKSSKENLMKTIEWVITHEQIEQMKYKIGE